MRLVAPALLELARRVGIIGEGAVVIAGFEVSSDGIIVECPVIEEHSHPDHALEDGESPVAVGVGGVVVEFGEHRDERLAEHGLHLAGVIFCPAVFVST